MDNLLELEAMAKTLRLDALDMVYQNQTGHLGGSLSAAEMVTALYFHKMRVDPKNPQWPERDRFVLSKGHAAPILYAALARKGFFPLEDLKRLRQIDSHLQGAPNPKTPGIDMSAGPLGQGLSAAVGMALAARMTGKSYHTWCMIGDGEMQEGQIWEAAMTAAKYKLTNLTAILDWNKVQMSGTNDEMMPMGDIAAKWSAFGWRVLKIQGNCMAQAMEALDAPADPEGRPTLILSDTVKSKGVSFMEGLAAWHGKAPDEAQYKAARRELEGGACQ